MDTLKEKYNELSVEKANIESEVQEAEEAFRLKENRLRELSVKLESFRVSDLSKL